MKTVQSTCQRRGNPDRWQQLKFASISLSAWLCLISLLAAFATATPAYKDRYALMGMVSGLLFPILLLAETATANDDRA